ncbi:RNA polymerase [Stappia sp. GBMRC 2046]|uniref:RNA polymerase n=1 Tax=Stappia sediminis TaxID=2692190 RepID=A0A7X3LR97_9HYPH|nr:NepR family anti-sigma factor [Stappia sediminis]MXN63640.1 RNA polymerase [Stappia sediminis]
MSKNVKSPKSGAKARSRPLLKDPNQEIGRKLKAYYQAIEAEPIPDKFLDLLEKLEEAERKGHDNHAG